MSSQEGGILPPVVVIVGPTAAGKSSLALALAHRFEADIVTADSRQVYRYMDIGTAKPNPAERAAIPHFMLDLVAPDQMYSAHLYRKEALPVLRRIGQRGRMALVVGGTGFYIRSLLDGLPLPSVPPDQALRRQLHAEAERHGVVALHERLREADPTSADRIHPNNLSRVIRALEIVTHLGGPVPSDSVQSTIPALYLGVSPTTPQLRQKIERRVHEQVEAGLVQEVKLLLDMGFSADATSLQGFGYCQMISHLRGQLSLREAMAAYVTATRQYARRQMTWFRSDSRLHWLDAEGDGIEDASYQIDRYLSTASSPA